MRNRFLVEGKSWAKVYETDLDFDTFCEWVRICLVPAERNVYVFRLELVTRHMDEVPFLVSGNREASPNMAPDQSAPSQDKSNDDDWS